MIYTARQLDEIRRQRSDGHLVLPFGSRLTPAGQDWIRQHKIEVQFADGALEGEGETGADAAHVIEHSAKTTSLFWWCDESCGAAKAALAGVVRETPVSLHEIGIDPRRASDVARLLSGQIGKSGAGHQAGCTKCPRCDHPHPAAALGVIFVRNAAAMMIYLNRCRCLRAVLGTSLAAVDLAVTAMAVNVLVIEYSRQNLPQMRNLLSRFVKGPRSLDDLTKRDLAELSTCE